MPLYREDNFLVVHPGSEYTIFLFGLQESLSPPEYKIPSIVYKNPVSNNYQAKKDEDSIEELEEIHPIQGGRIVDLDSFNYLLKTILQSVIANNPIVTINQIPLLLIAPTATWTREQVESITKYALETLEFTGFNILDLSIASTFGVGNGTTSLVVNVGKNSTQITPVVQCQALNFASKSLAIGGYVINEELSRLLPNLSEKQIEALKTSSIFEVVNDNESFYSMNDLKEDDDNFDVAKIVVEEDGIASAKKSEDEEQLPNNKLEKNTFTDPETKEEITVGKERFQGTSKLIDALSKEIGQVLSHIPDLERRQESFNNLIFVGSTFKIAGFLHALLNKVTEDWLVRSPAEREAAKAEANGINSAIAAYQQADDVKEPVEEGFVISQVPSSIRLAKYPEYFPEWKKPKESGGSWSDVYFLGGQIYAKQTFGGNTNGNGEYFVDTDNYEEKGPQAIWNAVI